jgi:hypothetical protein
MADYAGAVAAIRDRFVAQWVTGSNPKTPIAFQNEDFADQSTPWVYFEVINSASELQGSGTPGSHVWLYRGNIFVHVFVPVGYGAADAQALAVAAGEIFRTKQFYDTDPGCCVRTGVGADGEGPRVDGGGSGADNGNWWRVTATIPFEYWHLG